LAISYFTSFRAASSLSWELRRRDLDRDADQFDIPALNDYWLRDLALGESVLLSSLSSLGDSSITCS